MKSAMIFPNPSSEKGISKYSLDLIRALEKQGLKMDEVMFLQGKPFSLLKNYSKLPKYEIIHVQHEYNLMGGWGLPYFLLFGFLKFFRRKPSVLTMHTVLSQKEEFPNGGKIKTFLRKRLYKMQNYSIRKTFKKVTVLSKYFKKILLEEYKFRDDQVEVFPHAIIEDIKTISKEKARKELGLKGNVYLMIGTMTPSHGYDIVLKQAGKIGKTVLLATNPVVVNYRNAEEIKNFLNLNQEIVRTNKFENFVRFDLGQIPYEKWWKYFSASDLILLPYRGGICSGIFADAMAMQKPIVSSNVSFFEYVEKDFGCVKVAETEEDFPRAIKESMKPKNYKKMLGECKRYLQTYGLTPSSKRYKNLYESLVKASP